MQDYTLINKSKEGNILEKPKKFSWGWFIFSVFTGWFLIYLIYYFVKKPERVIV